jgi:hypothetical protein
VHVSDLRADVLIPFITGQNTCSCDPGDKIRTIFLLFSRDDSITLNAQLKSSFCILKTIRLMFLTVYVFYGSE